MRKLLFIAVSAAIAFGATLLPDAANAMGLGGAAGVRSAGDQLGLTEQVARVCRRICDDGYCRTRCFEERGDDRDRVYIDPDRRRERERVIVVPERERRDCARVGPVMVCN